MKIILVCSLILNVFSIIDNYVRSTDELQFFSAALTVILIVSLFYLIAKESKNNV